MANEKTVVILQSNYIPWKGYFDLMAVADEFIIYDEVQYTRRDWRNRNKIIINGAPHWLTIPVRSKGNFESPIDEIRVDGRDWAANHWRTIEMSYRRAPYFHDVGPLLSAAYERAAGLDLLTDVNEMFLRQIADILAIRTPLLRGRAVPRTTSDPTDRLIELCMAREATHYVSGPAARSYIDRDKFDRAGIALSYANYQGYPVYEQATSVFEHGVSMIDVLFRCGPGARAHLKSVSNRPSFLDPP